jgi:FkbM family methyltransferase
MDNQFHRPEEDFIGAYLKSGDVFIDAGANIGTLALLAASITGSNGKVVAIEANPRIYSYLKRNIDLNKFTNIRCIQVVLGMEHGVVSFTDLKWDELNRISFNQKSEKTVIVPMSTLDELVQEHDNINLIKLDVEGYEKFVLLGAKEILRKTRTVFFESDEQNYTKYDTTYKDLLAIYEESGFNVYRIVSGNLLERLSDSYVSHESENLIATRDISEVILRTKYNLMSVETKKK